MDGGRAYRAEERLQRLQRVLCAEARLPALSGDCGTPPPAPSTRPPPRPTALSFPVTSSFRPAATSVLLLPFSPPA